MRQLSTSCVCVVALMEGSRLLNTGLDAETLAICVRLCEEGVNPEALALVIQELRRETEALKVGHYAKLSQFGVGFSGMKLVV